MQSNSAAGFGMSTGLAVEVVPASQQSLDE
jgi:hypothetical protein